MEDDGGQRGVSWKMTAAKACDPWEAAVRRRKARYKRAEERLDVMDRPPFGIQMRHVHVCMPARLRQGRPVLS